MATEYLYLFLFSNFTTFNFLLVHIAQKTESQSQCCISSVARALQSFFITYTIHVQSVEGIVAAPAATTELK